MFQSLHMTNFALFRKFSWENHGRINVIVGRNDTGKSHLLKLLYALAKSLEEFSKKRKPIQWKDVLANKLQSTFEPDDYQLNQLIHKEARRAKVEFVVGPYHYQFEIGQKVRSATVLARKQELLNAIFVPPKELLTAFKAIEATRETLEIPGFDDTYYDLIRALRLPSTKGKIETNLKQVQLDMESLLKGAITLSKDSDRFVFKRDDQTFSMSQTAEGIKKVGILTTLIRNRTLNKDSILFMDEPETNLHPDYVVALMDMLMQLSEAGIQIYLATHSYFVIKQLHIRAKERDRNVTFCSLTRQGDTVSADFDDLREGMPDNAIIQEAIALYEREVELDFKRK